MFGRIFNVRALLPASERFRLQHSRWLTLAVAERRRYPRIPVRRVDTGGFGPLMNRPHGPARAERWWDLALERVEDT